MFTTAKAKSIALAVVAATAFLSLPALADAVDPRVPSVAVHYADLDLTTDAGVRVLYRRLQFASQRVCRSLESRELARAIRYRACYDQALTEAVAKVDVEMLSALHKNASAAPRVS